EADRELAGFRQDHPSDDRSRCASIGAHEPVVLPYQRHLRLAIEDDPSRARTHWTAARIADEHFDPPAAPHHLDVMITRHAELAAVARLVVHVRTGGAG